MMMLPSMTGDDSNMGFINQFGQPMNMIKIEMPGPDGKMMKFLQFPSMPQGAMPPVVMTQPVSGSFKRYFYSLICWCLLFSFFKISFSILNFLCKNLIVVQKRRKERF